MCRTWGNRSTSFLLSLQQCLMHMFVTANELFTIILYRYANASSLAWAFFSSSLSQRIKYSYNWQINLLTISSVFEWLNETFGMSFTRSWWKKLKIIVWLSSSIASCWKCIYFISFQNMRNIHFTYIWFSFPSGRKISIYA